MARKNENEPAVSNEMEMMIPNETTELSAINGDELSAMFGGKMNVPAILMFDQKKAVPLKDIINVSAGENLSLSEVINTELTLEGFGAIRLEYLDEETGELKDYIRYILFTDKGTYTTTSTFIGRTLKMLYQTMSRAPKVKFLQKDKEGRRRFMMEIL